MTGLHSARKLLLIIFGALAAALPSCDLGVKDEVIHSDPAKAPVIPLLGPSVRESIIKIYQRGKKNGMRPDVFAKMGDSITAYYPFLSSIGDGKYNVDRHWRLLYVIDRYRKQDLGEGRNSFNRDSFAGVRAWGAEHALDKHLSPCKGLTPLECEVKTIKPAYAIVMFGTNNVDRNFDEFVVAMNRIVESLVELGVVPIVSTIPDAPWTEKAAEEAHLANREIIDIANRNKVPLLNYWRALQDLPDKGISEDGVHPSVAPEGSGVFTAQGLKYGHNVRNYTFLATLEKLNVLLDGY